jgi:hypothetical protein
VCALAANRRWKQANPERCREHARESSRRWRAGNREHDREGARRWRQTHPAAVRARKAAYRAEKLRATPKWTRQQDLEFIEDSRWAFAAMHGLDEHEVHLDHLIPLKAYGYIDGKRVRVASGLHTPDNLTWKVGPENLRKGSSLTRALADIDEPPTFERASAT